MTNEEFLARVARFYDVKEDDRKVRIYMPISDSDERDILHNKDVTLYKDKVDNYYEGLRKWVVDFDVKVRAEANCKVNPEYWLEKLLTPDLHEQAFANWKGQVERLLEKIA
jgi:hypothetical protein